MAHRDDPEGFSPTLAADVPPAAGPHNSTANASPEFEAGTVLASRYRVIALLGRGGMGEVYRARDLVLGDDVAIKFLPPRLTGDASFMHRFVDEVRLARQVTHPNVCRVHDIGEIDGRRFLSMEYIDGEDLASLLRRIGRLPQEKSFELGQQLCVGVAALHEQGILHRDLKPSNVMIDGRGRLKIADFGLAVAEHQRTHSTREGTPAYMAPEQLEGGRISPQTDIYALGLILYELLSGRHPFAANPNAVTSASDRSGTAPQLGQQVRDLPSEVDDVIARCLQVDPAARPSSAFDVAAVLPGGDPIAAAIAAGRAPSVEAVANIRKQGSLSSSVAVGCVGLIAVLLGVTAVTAPRGTILGLTQPELPPEVLAHEASKILTLAGHDGPHADEFSTLGYDHELVSHLKERGSREQPEPRVLLSQEGPPVVLFGLRRNPSPLYPHGDQVTISDPPVQEPGAVRITIDARARLRFLTAVPPRVLSTRPTEPDWDALLLAAGVVDAEPTDAVLTPRDYADDRRAWRGTWKDEGIPVRVEAATAEGLLTSFEVLPSWDEEFDPKSQSHDSATSDANGWIVALMLLILSGLFVLARRNVVRKVADVRGAIRLALTSAVATAAGALARSHFGSSIGTGLLVFRSMESAAWQGVLTFGLYLVVEPYGRRFFPGAMVSWTRLVAGRWRDSLVARDVLFGCVFGAGFMVLQRVGSLITAPVFQPIPFDLSIFLGARHTAGQLTQGVFGGVFTGLAFFVFLLVLRLLLRRQWLALALLMILQVFTSVIATLPYLSGFELLGSIAITSAVVGGALLVLVRFGLLVLVVAQLVVNVAVIAPLTTNLGAWHAAPGIYGTLLIGALVAYGYVYASRR